MLAKPFVLALLFFAAFIPAGVWFLLDWFRQRSTRDISDREIEERLAKIERRLEDYPGGPLTIGNGDDGTERQI